MSVTDKTSSNLFHKKNKTIHDNIPNLALEHETDVDLAIEAETRANSRGCTYFYYITSDVTTAN